MALYYVAHRLFAAHDRALGAHIAHHLARRYGADAVFLPFCDTDEENLIHPCKGRRLFELDCQRLPRLDGVIAILHGPSLDDGVCMEIGYTAALGIPIVAVTTDFQVYGPTADAPDHCVFPDPLIQYLAATIITEQRLGPPLQPPTGRADGADDRFQLFLNQNLTALARATTSAIEAVGNQVGVCAALPPAGAGDPLAYLEPSPYTRNGARGNWVTEVSGILSAAGWLVHVAARMHTEDGRPAGNGPDLAAYARGAQADWDALGRSTMAIVDIGGPEAPPGAAAVIGACAATGRPVYAPDPGSWWTIAHGREPNYRNLMIQYGLTGTFTSLDQVAALQPPADALGRTDAAHSAPAR